MFTRRTVTAPTATVSTKRKPVPSAAPAGQSAWPANATSAWFVRVYAMPAIDRVAVVKRGVPAASPPHAETQQPRAFQPDCSFLRRK